jgi:hypothetical protein
MRPAKIGLFASVLVAGVLGFWSVNAQDTDAPGPAPEVGTQTGEGENADSTADLPVRKPDYRTDVSTSSSTEDREQPASTGVGATGDADEAIEEWQAMVAEDPEGFMERLTAELDALNLNFSN